MFYESVTALNTSAHHNAFVEPAKNYDFAKASSTIAIGVSEFVQACHEYPIIFISANDTVVPMVLTGLLDKKNTFISEEDGSWLGNYLPAYIRRYPFVLAQGKDDIMTVCIDESFAGFNRDGNGEKLFENKERSPFLEEQINFLQAFDTEMKRTAKFCEYLTKFGLLEESNATIERDGEKPHQIKGFLVISRERLANLSAKNLKELQKVGALELIYQHLISLSQFDALLGKAK